MSNDVMWKPCVNEVVVLDFPKTNISITGAQARIKRVIEEGVRYNIEIITGSRSGDSGGCNIENMRPFEGQNE